MLINEVIYSLRPGLLGLKTISRRPRHIIICSYQFFNSTLNALSHMHAANEKTRMKCINLPVMAPTTMTFNATNEMVASMHLSKTRPYKKEHACDAERPSKPGRRE